MSLLFLGIAIAASEGSPRVGAVRSPVMQRGVGKDFHLLIPPPLIIAEGVQPSLASFFINPSRIKHSAKGIDAILDVRLFDNSRLNAKASKGVNSRQTAVG